MQTLNINISDTEYKKIGIKSRQMTFAEFMAIINHDLTQQHTHRRITRKAKTVEKYLTHEQFVKQCNEEIDKLCVEYGILQ
jgi:predicted transcriptional regulator